ncbi:MAG: BatD family protein, partial [Verrucomicrobiae bacterium]|nr:BatD family protein [Verrucomicrobiae bacterium]
MVTNSLDRILSFPLWTAIVALLALIVATPGATFAQGNAVAVDATLLSKRIPLGEQTPLIVRVANGRPEALPDRIPVDGLTITRSQRVEQKMSFGTGGQQSEYHFYYTVVADQAGEFTIPSITAQVDGKEYHTESVTLTVYERDPSDPALDASRPYFANLECETREIWAGQLIPLNIAIYVRGMRSINDIGPPILRHDAFVFEYDKTYELDAIDLDGITFTTAKRPGSVFGLTPGSHSVGPAEIQVAMIDESSPFGRMPGFFQSFTAKTLRTNQLRLTVKPLPESGKPSTFRGAVGKFNLTVKASPLAISVGDPITLEFDVKGPGNYETLEGPAFLTSDPAQWRTYDARKIIDPSVFSDGVTSGHATFTQIVMPQTETTEIPPFELSFFNPETGAYEIQRTEPVAIKVTPDTRLAAASAGVPIPAGNGGSQTPGAAYSFEEVATPEVQYNDIVHIRKTKPKWLPAPASITARPMFWIGQIIPSIALFTMLGLRIARGASVRRQKRDRRTTIPFKSALAGVDEATSRGEFCRAVSLALDSWVNEAGPSSLKRLPESLRSEFEALRAHTQGILYGASD